MITSLYYHGDEAATTDLPVSRLRSALADPAGVLWVDLEAVPDADAIAVLDGAFGFHPLTIDDCLGGPQRPKIDDFEAYVFVVTFAPVTDRTPGTPDADELNLYLGSNYVVTFHKAPVPVLTALRATIGRDVRPLARGADRLAAEILAQLASGYMDVLDVIDGELEALETEMFVRPRDATLARLFVLRRRLSNLRRVVSPQREVLNRLAWDTFKPVGDAHRIYFRDAYDHLVRVSDLTESLRDLAAGGLETYLSVVSNRLNATMRWLAAVSTIFMPLTLVSSIYGMNFEHLPPFESPGGWQLVVGAMVLIAAGLAAYFRRRHWI